MDENIKERNWVFYLWMIIFIIFHVYNIYITKDQWAALQAYQDKVIWLSLIGAASSLLKIFFAIALFYWKKWGFWGICLLLVTDSVSTYFISDERIESLFIFLAINLISIAVIYRILNIGKHNKVWPQLV